MESLTKEEKNQMVEQRMAVMKQKNEARRKRLEEIEAENQRLGAAAAPPPTVSSSGWRQPDAGDNMHERQTDSHESWADRSGADWPGDKPPVQRRDSADPSENAHRQGGFGGPSTPSADRGDADSPAQRSPAQHGGAQATPSPSDRGGHRGARTGSGRLSGGQSYTRGRAEDQSYEATRKKNALAYEEELKAQGSSPGGRFLSDNFRDNSRNFDRTNQDSRSAGDGKHGAQATNRHPRNYGGPQGDLREKLKQDRQRNSAGPHEFSPALHMTGKQRLEHDKWKEDRATYDQQRLDRSRSQQGDWKREWDAGKNVQSADQGPPPEYNIYKEIDSKKRGPDSSHQMRGVQSNGTPRGRGRARGRARPNKPPPESAELPRKVSGESAQIRVTINTSADSSSSQFTNQETTPQKPNSHKSPVSPGKPMSPPQQTPPSPSRKNQQTRAWTGDGNRPTQSGQSSNSHKQYVDYRERGDVSRRGWGGKERGGGGGGGGRADRGRGDRRNSSRSDQMSQSDTRQQTSPDKQSTTTAPQSKDTTELKKDLDKMAQGASPAQPLHTLDTSTSSEEQEIIVAADEDEDEDGWVDCDTDEEFYAEEDEVTPHVSKEPTPARSDKTLSKESTPVPQDLVSSQGSQATASSEVPRNETKEDTTNVEITADTAHGKGEPTAERKREPTAEGKGEPTAEGKGVPMKASLHIDIRDPVKEEDDVEDVLKTPEGGRQHLDWAAEMEAESPINSPDVKLDGGL